MNGTLICSFIDITISGILFTYTLAFVSVSVYFYKSERARKVKPSFAVSLTSTIILSYSFYELFLKNIQPNKSAVLNSELMVVTSFKSSVITCPFMANVTQSEP